MRQRNVKRRRANAWLRRWGRHGESYDRSYPRVVAYWTGHLWW
jgi:hypothetical protein